MKNIWVNGCFDVVHAGHIELFKYAKSLGDFLYVGIDSDNRIKQMKGPNRPINNQICREILLSAIKYIDKVFIFDSDNELKQLLKSLHIHTMVIGSDYKNKNIVGSENVAEIYFFNRLYNLSSSYIIHHD